MPLPPPPAEPPRVTTLDGLAPKFRAQVEALFAKMREDGHRPIVGEAIRTPERAEWLAGFGRTWDDGRGQVTKALDGSLTWHAYGLAVDVWDGSRASDPWNVTGDFRASLGSNAAAVGLVWGGLWQMRDYPHVQWADMKVGPGLVAQGLYKAGRPFEVWPIVGAA